MDKRKVTLSMQMTLDGFVCGPNDEMDWTNTTDDELWREMFQDLQSVDTYFLGRKMYPGYADYWRSLINDPKGDPNVVKFAKIADETQHIVFTHGNLKTDWKNTRVAHDVKKEIADLRQKTGKDIFAWGGAGFAASLIGLDVLDGLRIVLNPILIGKGKSMTKDLNSNRKLKLRRTRPLNSGLVILDYDFSA
jgi:dihydrofolate reductase